MLSVADKTERRWIRSPFMTQNEVNQWIIDYLTDKERYDSLELYREETLDEIVSLKKSNGDYKDITLRELLFGSTYEGYAKMLRGTFNAEEWNK